MAKSESFACEPRIKITYSKTDTLIKNFLEAEGSQKIGISKLIQLAIEYYAITGEFLHLGTVSVEDEHPDKLRKTIYISKDSDAHNYISRAIEEGSAKKRVIWDIINGGIEVGESTQIMDVKTFIIRQNELAKLRLGQKQRPSMPSRKEIQPVREVPGQTAVNLKDISKSKDIAVPTDTISEQKKKKKRVTFADEFIKNDFK